MAGRIEGDSLSIEQVTDCKEYVTKNASEILMGLGNIKQYEVDQGMLLAPHGINYIIEFAIKNPETRDLKTPPDFAERVNSFFDAAQRSGNSLAILPVMQTMQRVELLANFIFGKIPGARQDKAFLLLDFLKKGASCLGHNPETEFGFYDSLHDPKLVDLALRYSKLNQSKPVAEGEDPMTYLDLVNFHIWKLNHEKWEEGGRVGEEPGGASYGSDNLFKDPQILEGAIREVEKIKAATARIEAKIGLITRFAASARMDTDIADQINGKVWYYHHKRWEEGGSEGAAPGGDTWGFDHREDDLEIFERAVDDVAREFTPALYSSDAYAATTKEKAFLIPYSLSASKKQHSHSGMAIYRLLSDATSSSLRKDDFDLCMDLVEELSERDFPEDEDLLAPYMESNLELFDLSLRFIALGNSAKAIMHTKIAEKLHQKWEESGSLGEEPPQTKEEGEAKLLEDKEVFRQALIETELAEFGKVKNSLLTEAFPVKTPIWPSYEELTGYGKATVYEERLDRLFPMIEDDAATSDLESGGDSPVGVDLSSGAQPPSSPSSSAEFMPVSAPRVTSPYGLGEGASEEELAIQQSLFDQAEERFRKEADEEAALEAAAIAHSLDLAEGLRRSDSPETLAAFAAAAIANNVPEISEEEKDTIRAMRVAVRS